MKSVAICGILFSDKEVSKKMRVIVLPLRTEFDISDEKEEILFGSDPRCDVVVDINDVPPVFARLYRKKDKLIFRSDQDFQDGKKKTRKTIINGEKKLDFGRFILHFSGESNDEMDLIESFINDISSYTFDQELLKRYLERMIEITGAEKALLYYLENGVLTPLSIINMSKDEVDEFSETLLKEAIQKKEPMLINGIDSHPLFSKVQSIVSSGIKSILVFPLLVAGELSGIIYLSSTRTEKVFTEKDLKLGRIFSSIVALVLRNFEEIELLKEKNVRLEKEVDSIKFSNIIGSSEGMMEIFKIVEKVSKVDIPVLILGETGTGKELIAREIHRLSSRRKYPFVSINCGAIPATLLESELFGYVKGAFTGAFKDKKGKFQVADKGTLFLDEIGDLDLSLQVKLLRVLQDGIVYRVGSETPEKVDVRIIAATNKNLEEAIEEGKFREDLYYRLNVITINLPPLRERKKDIILIAKYLLEKYRKDLNPSIKGFTKEALVAMENYHWPGNIREMENKIKKALVLAEGEFITPEDLDLSRKDIHIMTLAEAKEKFQEEYIEKVLLLNNGNRTKTARDLGVDPRTIFRYLEKKKKKESGT